MLKSMHTVCGKDDPDKTPYDHLLENYTLKDREETKELLNPSS